MFNEWQSRLIERLIDTCNAAGAWGYRAVSTGAAEPTALAALALAATVRAPGRVEAALRWLGDLQQDDGAVPISGESPSPHWPTALALVAWLRCAPDGARTHAAEVGKALGWLLEARGQTFPPDPTLHDHDTSLVGWPWVAGTHSWIEPTAYAVLALRAADQGDHPRVREGVELILDRALPDGGWNYGNRRVLEHLLRPFPATTGVALAALAGEPQDDRIAVALGYLGREMPRVRAPLSLAWGLIGMRAWAARPPEAASWLDECARRMLDRPANPLYDALLLLAGAETSPLVEPLEVPGDG